ncbi:MAG: molybdopterin biosynthesis protein [Halobacteriales archaeon]
MSRKEFRDLADPGRMRSVIGGLGLSAGVETVPLEAARGRVLAERIDAGIDVPGFDRASMDGYAVRATDTVDAPVGLEHAGTVHAGEAPGVEVGAGEAVEISTGAVMPAGADAVVIVERTEERDGEVWVRESVAPGANVMLAGADIAAGERGLGPGTRLSPREIGLLSALGVEDVPVRASPRVGIVSTGDELVRPGGDLDHRAGQIHDVNSYTVAAGVEEAGGEPVLYPHVGDDPEAMEDTLRGAAGECDLILTSGSTSASAMDVLHRVIEDDGELLLHGVAVKPGKPTMVGRFGGAAYVGLPGYPVSALTIFRTFVAPAIREAAGLPEPERGTADGRMAVRERYEEGRLRFMPVGLIEDGDGETLVYPVDKGSGATTSLVDADGVVAMDPDVEYLAEGEAVEVELFSPETRPPAVFGVGEADPAFARLLDRVERPRYLPVGSREGVRRLREGVPDVAVAAGPDVGAEATELGGWIREWGLVVPPENPEGIEGLGDLVDRDLRFVNRGPDAGLRASLGAAIADLAEERGAERHDLVDAVDGFDLAARGVESPARKVADGDADAGLGLRATAATLGLGFVSLGDQRVRVLANPEREGKPGVAGLADALADADEVLAALPGFT